ncbi:putative transcriptional regulator, TetR family protein [Pseudovibrio japonicus]|uniref:Transcriptional regulator, TetR family protein n=1 Tax=Pseudovibrio japonicus TaxID=366534 RepID=A0ABQ3ELP4_9HYPH|nr:TetR/AcrR family transcriptional regulator [Pseudovibrio japonicus]GHB45997.1 putative transcriptional regulator, TetR family protein [Pseudovibrio japonicus]
MTDMSVIMGKFMSRSNKLTSRDRLVRAAIEVFGTRGYHATRVSDLVSHAGVAHGTFYLYFDNKEAIFLYLVDDFFTRLQNQTLDRFPASAVANTGELNAQLLEMWRSILGHCRCEPFLTALILRESYAVSLASRTRVEERFAQTITSIGTYLKELAKRGIIRGSVTDASAWGILGLIERAIHYAVVVNPEAEVDTLAHEFLQIELNGLLGDREGLGAA